MDPLTISNPQKWNDIILNLPTPHILQTFEWGQVKAQYGWEPNCFVWKNDEGNICASAMVLSRSLSVNNISSPFQVFYIPKGPNLDWADSHLTNRVIKDIQNYAEEKKAIFIKIDPDIPVGWGIPGDSDAGVSQRGLDVETFLSAHSWRFSEEQIQFRNTILIDLTQAEEAILAGMKQKTRYNIRLATRKGIRVRKGSIEDIPALCDMYTKTAVRDGFVIRSPDYYQYLWEKFINAGMAEPLVAEFDHKPVAAVFIFYFAGVSRYLYGMSLEEERARMPNYLLQWEAICRSKELGCFTYDMWGAPDKFNEDDSLWGVYRFKEGFNGKVLRTIGAWDYPSKPIFYQLYSKILPRVLSIMRLRGMKTARKRSAL